MTKAQTASGRFDELNSQRGGFIRRCETYARYTLPKICLPDGYDQNNQELTHDFQAVGAQAVNHLSNKIILAAFAPSRPFFRADPDAEIREQLSQLQLSEADIVKLLSQAEKDAVKLLDQLALRPKLYECIKHLIITGNVLLHLAGPETRVMGIKKYVVRRSATGRVVELIIADKVQFDELEPEVREAAQKWVGFNRERDVTHYRWFKRNAKGDYEMTQWIDSRQLAKEFNGKWPEAKLPFRVLTCDLSDGAHYGTGLVEDYRGDFAALSTLTQSQVMAAVLSSEFRWLVNPAGMTSVEDFENSENGSAIPGNEGDINLVQSGKAQDLQITMSMAESYVNRIGRGFLMGAGLVRDAERVTREEILMIANELETALGGAYSRIAVDIQLPLAYWLMDQLKLSMSGSGFTPTIVTGLDALSRQGDLEDLKMFVADLGLLATVPEDLRARMKLDEITTAFGAGRRIAADRFLKSEDEVAAEQQEQQAQQMEQYAATGVIDASVKAAGQPEGTPE